MNLGLKSAHHPKHPLKKWLFQLDDESNLYLGNGWKSPNTNCKNCSLGYQEGISFLWFGKAINLKGHMYIPGAPYGKNYSSNWIYFKKTVPLWALFRPFLDPFLCHFLRHFRGISNPFSKGYISIYIYI